MAEFHEIGSSQFTDVTPTGEEKIQISASQRTTLQNIANLAPEKGVKQVVVTSFQTNTWKLSDGGSVSFPMDIKDGEIVTFTSAQDAVKGPGVGLFGYAIKHNSLMASYVGMTISNKVNGIPTIYTYKSAGAYDTAWQQLPDASVKTVEITDFAIPGLNITKDGESFLFYANDASNIPNSNHGATSFVGVAIASPIFITGNQRFLYYMMVDTASGMFYTGRANLEDNVVAWNTTPITRLGQAVQVTAFTEPALSALLYSYKPGDFIPFFTNSVTASTANQFPESGIFNGFISMGRNEGDYFQIFAFKTGAGGKAYSGSCIGSTTTWTELGGGGGSLSDSRISGWSNITKYGDVQDPYIQNGDTLVDALRKLQWMTGNNIVKTFGNSSGIGMIWWNGDTQNNSFTAFYLMMETQEIYFIFEDAFSNLGDQATEDQIIAYIVNNGIVEYIGLTPLINYVSGTNVAMNLSGKDSLWYTGSSNPTLTLLEPSFNNIDPTASFICAYNITPTFQKQNSTSVIHMHQNAADVAPTSGYKVYTILCHVVWGSVKHFFINVAPYN